MARISIRLRLTAWYALALLAGLALFGAAMWIALERRLVAGVDAVLEQRVQGLRTVVEVEGASDRVLLRQELSEFAREVPDGSLIEVRDPSGALLVRPAAAARHKETRALNTRFEYGGRTYDVRVAASLDEVRAVMSEFRHLLLLLIPAVLGAACAGGYWMSRRALAPVDEITRVAGSISVNNLSRRLTVPNTGDELQRMSETWNDVLERLEGAVKRIRQFTADASHELRTPLALIRSTAELALRRERSPAEYRQSLADIERETARMTDLTESLLALARADAQGMEMPLAPVDLNAVVTEVVRESEGLARAKGLLLRAALTKERAVAALNESGVRRLLLILIDNAVRHTPPGGAVTVATAARDSGVVLAVEDTGEGIAPDALPHIFERFFRADAARGGSGAGLGLSIAQAIAQAHRSDIAVESAPGQGARFTVVFKRLNGW